MSCASKQNVPPEKIPRTKRCSGAAPCHDPSSCARDSAPASSAARSAGRPSDSATARSAASARLPAATMPSAASSGSAPRKIDTTGVAMPAACASTAAATVGCGGFETSTMTFVSGSSSSQRIPRSIEMPPIASARSCPPVPIACDTPEPSSWMRAVTSWVPVPDAPTTPIGPRRTTFAKPSGMPLTIAVPQSGPMTMRS